MISGNSRVDIPIFIRYKLDLMTFMSLCSILKILINREVNISYFYSLTNFVKMTEEGVEDHISILSHDRLFERQILSYYIRDSEFDFRKLLRRSN